MTERIYVRGSADERFDAKWRLDPVSGCHLWVAGKQTAGYGSFWVGGNRYTTAHQYAYERKYGPVPRGLVLDHAVCDTPACCNPDHLRPVTIKENVDRSPTAFVARTHCPQGHPYDEANTYHPPGTSHRRCRACATARDTNRKRG